MIDTKPPPPSPPQKKKKKKKKKKKRPDLKQTQKNPTEVISNLHISYFPQNWLYLH